MRLHKQPLLKPYQQTDERGHQKYHTPKPTYIEIGDYVEMPSGKGYIEAIRYNNNRRQFRLDSGNRWHDELRLINRLSYKNHLWWNFH